MKYGWIIDKDFNPDPDARPGTNSNAVGVMGPSSISKEHVEQLRHGEGHKFRMEDDDGNVCYEGRFVGEPGTEEAFGPLDDFGTPNAGCTNIYYWVDNQWSLL